MRPVSARFLRTIRTTHRMRVRAKVLTSFQSGTTPTGTEILVLGGSVTLDANAAIRSTLDLITDGTWGTGATSLLTPYGNEIFVERGIDYGAGETEWVSLGYFRIDSVEMDGQDGEIRITGSDRMAQVLDNRIVYPTPFAGSATHSAVFDSLIKTSAEAPFSTATINFDYVATTQTMGAASVTKEDRYAYLRDAIDSLGKVMFWDDQGFLSIRSSAVTGAYVFAVDTGAEGVLVSLSRQLSRQSVYNGVLVRGAAPDEITAPPSALATNSSLTDPLRWGGPFGKVVRFFESQFITTTAQATTAATAILARQTGLPYDVDMTTVPNPALEPLDVIRMTLGDGTVEDHVIEQLVIPLTADQALTLKTRTKNASDS